MTRQSNLAAAAVPPPGRRRREMQAICALSGGIGGWMLGAQLGSTLGPAGAALGPVGALGASIFQPQPN